jgi:hypothetical protein
MPILDELAKIRLKGQDQPQMPSLLDVIASTQMRGNITDSRMDEWRALQNVMGAQQSMMPEVRQWGTDAARMDMTAAQRKATPPELRKDAIVRYK